MGFIHKHFRPFYGFFLIAILFLSVETMADLAQPLLVSKLVDEGIGGNDFDLVKHYGFLMLLATGIGLIGALMRNWLASHTSYLFAKELREVLFAKLMTLSVSQVEELESGSLITRLTSDVSLVHQFVNGLMRIFLKAPLLAVGSFFMVMRLDNRFMKVYLILIPLILLMTLVNIKIGFPLYSKIQIKLDKLNQKTMEFLGGIRAVRGFNRFDYEYNTFRDISHELRSVTTKTLQIMGVFGPLIMLTINLAVVFVIYTGKDWVFRGEIGVGQIIAFVNYMTQFFFAMSMISRVFTIFVRAKSSIERLAAVADLKEDFPTKETTLDELEAEDGVMELGSDICMEEVSFSYGSGVPTLNNISFHIEKGESIGILGGTGSGKTTLIHLINRTLFPTKGQIFIGGEPLSLVSKERLTKCIGFVSQKTLLFTGTILENLNWGKRDMPMEHYEKALDQASALEFVKAMPKGLDTLLGKNGVNVSGGQKQRLSIARALAHQPKILILDDSTSSVDVITEQRIKSQVRGLNQMTLLMVAQKATSVRDLDRIMILENGEITAFDTHEQLLKNSSMYKALYEAEMGVEIACG